MLDGNNFESMHDSLAGPGVSGWMAQGAKLHAAGQPEQALLAFERAHALAPLEINAAAACAALLTELNRPGAAYKVLLAVEDMLMQDPDGAANLAIAAEACGDMQKAGAAYTKALALDPNHLRTLTNLGFLAASAGQWDIAITLARKCIQLEPQNATNHANLSEYLAGARRYEEGLEITVAATAEFPQHAGLKVRRTMLLAFHGDLETADAAFKSLDASTRPLLDDFLLRLEAGDTNRRIVSGKALPQSAFQIYTAQAFRNLAVGDWRSNAKLTDILRNAVRENAGTNRIRNWGDAPFHGLALDLGEEELQQMRQESAAVLTITHKGDLPVFKHRPGSLKDSRIRIGMAVPSLQDTGLREIINRQLSLYDATRFEIHVYVFSGHPDLHHTAQLKPHAASVNELGHMTDLEAAGRIRLDRLDVYMEMALGNLWSKREIAAIRVAPLQLRHLDLYEAHVPGIWDYSISDAIIQGDTARLAGSGAIVRMPVSCWFAATRINVDANLQSREEAGFAEDALVLCSTLACASLNPATFALWMKILRALPDAVLWLPACGRAADNLAREAKAAGVNAARFIFSRQTDSSQLQALLGHADIFLDPLCMSAAAGLADALALGLPAISCEGARPASRLGASMLRAAGLPECIVLSPKAYAAEVVRLGRDAEALTALKLRVASLAPASGLFDLPLRIREWENAWTIMVERSRAGLPPEAFDVPAFTSSNGH